MCLCSSREKKCCFASPLREPPLSRRVVVCRAVVALQEEPLSAVFSTREQTPLPGQDEVGEESAQEFVVDGEEGLKEAARLAEERPVLGRERRGTGVLRVARASSRERKVPQHTHTPF